MHNYPKKSIRILSLLNEVINPYYTECTYTCNYCTCTCIHVCCRLLPNIDQQEILVVYPVDTALPHPATVDLSRALPWTYLKIICFKLNSIQTIDSSLVIIVIITYMHVHVVIITCACICHSRQLLFLRKSDCLGCAVLLCLICLFDFACFFLSSLIKNMYNVHCTCACARMYIYMYTVCIACVSPTRRQL